MIELLPLEESEKKMGIIAKVRKDNSVYELMPTSISKRVYVEGLNTNRFYEINYRVTLNGIERYLRNYWTHLPEFKYPEEEKKTVIKFKSYKEYSDVMEKFGMAIAEANKQPEIVVSLFDYIDRMFKR